MRHARSRSRKGTGHKRRRIGRGIGSWFKNAANKVNGFLKSSKIISKVAPVLGTALGSSSIGNTIGNFAGAHGYGMKRHRRHGSGVRHHRSHSHAGRGPYRFDLPPFAAGRGLHHVRRHRGRGTPGMGQTDPTTYPISTSIALPRF